MSKFAVFLMLLTTSVSCLAARPNYNYLGLGYVRHEISTGNSCVQDGIALEGSLVMNEHFYVAAEHIDVTSDEWCGSTTTKLSGGFRSNVGVNSSVYSVATVLAQDSGNDTDPGLGLELGVRTALRSGVEAQFFIGYDLIDNFDESYIGAGFNYWIARRFSLLGQAELTNEDTSRLSLGFRFNF